MRPVNFRMSRRDFLRYAGTTGAGLLLAACNAKDKTMTEEQPSELKTLMPTRASNTQTPFVPQESAASTAPKSGDAYLAVARGSDVAAMTTMAVAAIGGMERFVKNGYDVIIKPNICTDYYPSEYGATTNPDVVATLILLALGAGAKRVRVMDSPFGGTAQSAYERSGIAAAVAAAGGEMEVMNQNKFVNMQIPNHIDIGTWNFYQDILNADLVINVPIAKHHSSAGLTLGCKNMMGVITDRGGIHINLHKRIADLVSLVQPELTVVDAVRTLMANGPTGGNLDDVRMTNTIIASHDIVAADTFAATLFDQTPNSIAYIRNAESLGLGTADLSSIKLEEITI